MSASHLDLENALAPHGLRLRGGWVPGPGDALPLLPHGQQAAVLWLVGVIGSDMWPAFKASPFFQDGQPDPLDRWSQAIGSDLAQRWGGRALFPFEGPPYHPFQQWAQRAEPLQTSPLLLQIHPQYGLWHAYRFALALPTLHAGDLPLAPVRSAPADLCLRCDGQPCLSACPVQAYDGHGFRLDACAAHLHTEAGTHCMQSGCLARHACPQGASQRYTPEHAAFHMRAFTDRH